MSKDHPRGHQHHAVQMMHTCHPESESKLLPRNGGTDQLQHPHCWSPKSCLQNENEKQNPFCVQFPANTSEHSCIGL